MVAIQPDIMQIMAMSIFYGLYTDSDTVKGTLPTFPKAGKVPKLFPKSGDALMAAPKIFYSFLSGASAEPADGFFFCQTQTAAAQTRTRMTTTTAATPVGLV